jgi:hypothetical protein
MSQYNLCFTPEKAGKSQRLDGPILTYNRRLQLILYNWLLRILCAFVGPSPEEILVYVLG